MKKVINEKVQNVSFYTVSKNGDKTLLKSSDISYLYFDWKKIFGIAEPEIGHDYALTKTLLKALKKDGEKGLNTVRRYMGGYFDISWEDRMLDAMKYIADSTEHFGNTSDYLVSDIVDVCDKTLKSLNFRENKVIVSFA